MYLMVVSHRVSHCHILPKYVITVSHCVQRLQTIPWRYPMTKYVMEVCHGWSMYVMRVSHDQVCHGGMSWLIDVCHEGIPWRSMSWRYVMVDRCMS